MAGQHQDRASRRPQGHPFQPLEEHFQTLYRAWQSPAELDAPHVRAAIRSIESACLALAYRIFESPRFRGLACDPRDAVQTFFAVLWTKGWRKCRADRPLYRYLYPMFAHVCADMGRYGKRRRATEFDEQLPVERYKHSQRRDVETEECRAQVRAAVNALPSHLKTAVIYRHLQGHSAEEAAALCGVTRQKLNAMTFRARAKLEAMLAKYAA
jgi:RNA polymerase sigma factor (sigma-70 family)